MTDRERLLRRVCLAPDDDTPRLIFADWCDEHGEQERAEFIRLQCLLASRYPPSIDDRLHCTKPFRAGINMVSVAGVPKGTPMATCGVCEACRDMVRLRQRELELLHHHEREWMGELGPHTWINPSPHNESRACWVTDNATTWIAPEWDRGWIAVITCTAAQWLTHGPAIVQQQPITRVVLSDKRCVMGSYGSSEWAWFDSVEGESGDSDVVPPPLWGFLVGGVNFYVHPEDGVKLYYSEADASEALSAAALLWARTKAGLEVTA